jgi:uncharacterized protein (DUF488 family)
MGAASTRDSAETIWTVGHSNVAWEAFAALLRAHDVAAIADVRAYPASRRWPHFNRDAMSPRLADIGIRYHWLPALGGRRGAGRADSPHTAWTVAGFRNYADHMDTDVFAAGLRELEALARERRTAFMCAEALHWRCHRRLLADRLVSLGWRVLHIRRDAPASEHEPPDFVRVVEGRLLYDGPPADPEDPQGTLPLR